MNLFIRILIFSFILLIQWGHGKGFAQNLVPNPSFEEYDTCPSGYGGNNLSNGWFPFRSSPDYFNACATDIHASVPINVFGSQMAATGNAYCGFISYHPPNDWNEMVGRKLSTTLVLGTKYYVSVKFSLADYSPCSINKLGVLFTTHSYCDSLDSFNICYSPEMPIPNFAHVFSSQIIADTAKWTIVSGSFIADSAYQYIVIGNLFDYANTNDSLLYGNTNCNGNYVCYYVDDICVSTDLLICNNPDFVHDLNITNSINIFPNPVNNFINITWETPFVEGISFNIYDIYGSLVKQIYKISKPQIIDVSNFSNGVYIIEINIKNKIYYKKIIIKFKKS
ncbi:MAG: T9SS type A sorting domain-containing protein [Bacteroidales bacterium]